MLTALQGRASERKARLFTCACCHRIRDILSFPEFIRTVEVAERFADGRATLEECRRAYDVVERYYCSATPENDYRNCADLAVALVAADNFGNGSQLESAGHAASCARDSLRYRVWMLTRHSGGPPEPSLEFLHRDTEEILTQLAARYRFESEEEDRLKTEEEAKQIELLRDIFVNPSRPIEFPSIWLTTLTVAFARQMYESCEFSTMLILADALEDAGCDNIDILSHCRDQRPHVRGCWVLDELLGME